MAMKSVSEIWVPQNDQPVVTDFYRQTRLALHWGNGEEVKFTGQWSERSEEPQVP